VAYLPFGPMSQITFQNGKTLSQTYDQNYDIDSILSTATHGLNLDYSIDEVGNIKQVNQSGAVFNLAYDKLYRLLSVKDQNQALIEEFGYDATGNRTSKKIGSSLALNYSYPAANHKLIDAGNGARAFDANGNTTTLPGNVGLTYDERNRLSAASSISALSLRKYNARGERIEKIASASQNGDLGKTIGGGCIGSNFSELFMYSESGALLGHYDLCSPFDEDVVYIDSIPVARVLNQAVFPLEADHLGSPRAMQNPDGTASVWTWNLLSNLPTGSNAFGEQAPTGKQVFNLRFPGQYADGDGLHYNYFRDYEAGTGRYVESDPIGLKGGIATYAYTFNRPLMFSDPTGEAVPAILVCLGGGCEAAVAWCAAVGATAVTLFAADTAIQCANGDLGICADRNKERCYADCYVAYEVGNDLCRQIRTKRGRQICWENQNILLSECQRKCK